MLLALGLNIVIVAKTNEWLYAVILVAQLLFYTLSFAGWVLEKRRIKIKALFVPYYFCVMNYAVLAGIRRYIAGSQSAIWDKAKRKSAV
jgi:biofilm PGA synthesis N-glycosyltransferase PgaC